MFWRLFWRSRVSISSRSERFEARITSQAVIVQLLFAPKRCLGCCGLVQESRGRNQLQAEAGRYHRASFGSCALPSEGVGQSVQKSCRRQRQFSFCKSGICGGCRFQNTSGILSACLGVLGGYPSSSAPLWWGGMDAAAVLGVGWGRCELKRPCCSTAELTLCYFFWCNEKVGVEHLLSICFVLLLPSCRCLLGFEDFFFVFFLPLCYFFFPG